MVELHNRTKIIATLGPACSDAGMIRKLMRAGADCFRINFSHVDGEQAEPLIRRVREASEAEGLHIPILGDIQGPKLRIGAMPEEGVQLREGQMFTLTGRRIEVGDAHTAQSQYEHLADDVGEGTTILLADGTIELRVERVDGPDVQCRVVTGGRLHSNKGINVPRTRLSVETLTDKDRRDLRYIAASDIDLVAVSFVRSGRDVETARQILGSGTETPVMAKLEVPEVLDNLETVLDASDGVMVARGDLGVEVPFEQVPGLQKQILRRAAARGKWAVVATQMLGSMVLNKRPSRAEVSDVANAVLDGADTIMLSEETATGHHPREAVGAMARICAEAEKMLTRSATEFEADIMSFAAGAANAAVSAAGRLQATAIVTLAGSGQTALAVSKWRPRIPIVALSAKGPTLRRLNVLRGVMPVALEEKMDMDQQIAVADDYLLDAGLASPGQIVVSVAALPLGQHQETNTIRFHRVQRDRR